MRHYYVLWAAVLLLAVASLFAVWEVVHILEHQNDALSAIICHAEHLIRTTKGLTPDQKQNALRFYAQQIKLEHLKPCK